MSRYLQSSRRERQILDILYLEGRATAARIRERMPDAPSYSAVRAHLRVLEVKGCVRHEAEGVQYVYVPTVPRDEARDSALKHLVRTFFGDSVEAVVVSLVSGREFTRVELDRLAELIDRRRMEERRERSREPRRR